MTRVQFVQECLRLGHGPEVYNASYPHPYLIIWLECMRHANHLGTPAYPEPLKGHYGQDADLMLAFQVLGELAEESRAIEEAHHKSMEAAQKANMLIA